jgi:hypothetical protein
LMYYTIQFYSVTQFALPDPKQIHPELEKEDILASLKFAKMYLSGQSIQSIS